MNVPKEGTCYCGCGERTGGYFATGHDGRAASMLHHLIWGTTNIAEILYSKDYGPGPDGKNLEAEALAAGWKPKSES
jgi:hypothetical protein